MIWAASALGLLLALGIAALFTRYTLHLNVQGRGDPSGQWALAGGAKVGPVSVAGVGGRGATATVLAHVFGRQVMKRDLFEASDEDERDEDEDEEKLSLRQRYAALSRWVDPLDLALFVISERRRIAAPEMELDLEYSFEDIMMTGQLMSAVHLLNALLPAPMLVRQDVSWEFVDRAAFDGHGRLVCRPGLVLWDVCVFLSNNLRLRRPTPATGVEV